MTYIFFFFRDEILFLSQIPSPRVSTSKPTQQDLTKQVNGKGEKSQQRNSSKDKKKTTIARKANVHSQFLSPSENAKKHQPIPPTAYSTKADINRGQKRKKTTRNSDSESDESDSSVMCIDFRNISASKTSELHKRRKRQSREEAYHSSVCPQPKLIKNPSSDRSSSLSKNMPQQEASQSRRSKVVRQGIKSLEEPKPNKNKLNDTVLATKGLGSLSEMNRNVRNQSSFSRFPESDIGFFSIIGQRHTRDTWKP